VTHPSRPSRPRPRPHPQESSARLVFRKLHITQAQDESLDRHAARLGIGKSELLRRVLDEWRQRAGGAP
jgi:hypothetical protein